MSRTGELLRSAGMAIAVLALAAAGAARAADDDYPDAPACRKVKDLVPPKADLPTAGQTAALKGCDPEKLYYGEGVNADPVKARLCAFAGSNNGETASDEVFGGQTILMMIYANGAGVRPNLDLALHYACLVGGAPAEIEGRISHLAEIKAKGPGKDPFDFCDDITSGLAEGYCASREQTRAEIHRKAELDALANHVAPAALDAYGVLRKAAYAFADARSGNEVDMSGTARAAMSIGAEEESRDAFVKQLKAVLARAVPAATPAQAKAADAALNAVYARLRANAGKDHDLGTVTFEGIQTAQRAWLKYRDAFLAFAKAQDPAASTDGLLVALTKARTADLADLAEGE